MTGYRVMSRNRGRESDVLEAMRKLGIATAADIAERAGYRVADVVRSLHALAGDGAVVASVLRHEVAWSVAR